jgi:large subunit GTPase 1
MTLFVDKELMLCDCPGLVMPSFVFTKADLIINGILPIDQMRDHRPPVNIICSQIPKHILEDQFSIMVTKPLEGEDPNRPPTADEFLNAYACNLITN